jgi:hypothetical protein
VRRAEDWRRNLGLKVLSVALAALLWSFVHGAKIVERELVLPLRCINLADSLALAAPPPAAARVLLSGAAQDFVLRRLYPGAELRVDLSRARPPLVRINPTATEVAMGGSSRLTVVRILEPSVIDVAVDRRAGRRVRVRVTVAGQPAPGWRLAATPRAEPAFVLCVGAASRIDSVHAVATRAVDIAGRQSGLDARVDLIAPRAGMTLQPATVRVFVELEAAGHRIEPGAGGRQAAPAVARAEPGP